MSNWKAYDEVHFSDKYILRWIREGDEYVNRITCDMMEDLQDVVKVQKMELDELKKAFSDLFKEYKEYCEQVKAQNERK